jgi:CubicO group peptidase (beta-lactamase class C family)
MRTTRSITLIFATLALCWPAIARAEDVPAPAGHWEGAIELPGKSLKIDIDLVKGGDAWSGDISIPEQGAKDLPLKDVKLDGIEITFALPGVPGNARFKGTISGDKTSISGDFSQGGQTFPFKIARGDSVAVLKKSLEGFDAFVERTLKDFKVPGLAIAIVKDGEVIYSKGFGRRDIEADLPVTTRTLFAIGSCSKAFTTFVMGTLVDDGKLEWDKPVRTYLPGFRLNDPPASELITPRDLVTHRSGMPRHDLVWYNARLSRKEIVDRLPHLELNESFRGKFQYNNLMYMTAGYLVEQLTGQSWEDAVRRRIFEPLGMASSNFSVLDSQKASDFARGYKEDDDKIELMPFRDITTAGPAGSINSSVEDMARWLAVHSNRGKLKDKTILSAPVLADIHTPHMTIGQPSDRPEISPMSYALGWFVDDYRGHRRIHHGGNIDGFSADAYVLPNDGLGLVLLSNKNGTGLPGLVAQHALDRLLKLEPIDWSGEALKRRKASLEAAKAAKAKKTSVRRSGTHHAHSLEEYAGDYEHPGYGSLKVELRDGSLSFVYNSIDTPLEHWHFEVFSGKKAAKDPAFEDMKLQFRDNLRGDVDGLAVPFESSVKPIVFARKPDAKLSDPDYLKRFAGDYELAGQTLTVRLKGNVLALEAKGQAIRELVPDRADGFTIKGVSAVNVRFVSDKDGKVTEATLVQPGGVFTAKRKS